jgi:hypothetical protein
MQSAFINPQSFATPVAQPLNYYQPLVGMSPGIPNPVDPGMTQLPSMPRPPYLQSNLQSVEGFPALPTPGQLLSASPSPGSNGFINNGATGLLSNLPTPQQLAPNLYNQVNPAYQTAASFPVAMAPALPEVPSPYMVAPWLYLAKPAMPQVPPTVSYAPPLMRPQQPLIQPQQPLMQAPPRQQQAPPLPVPQQQPPQPPAPTQEKAPSRPLGDSGLTDTQIHSLNERLNDDSEDTRADAAIELFKILDKDPSLSTRAPYNQYVNAFMEKIMKDPSAVVRAAGELALQTGRVKQPSEGVMNQISVLSKNPGGLSGEGGVISSIMGSIKNQTLGQGFSDLPGAMTTVPGSEEAAQLQKSALTPPTPESAAPSLPPNGQANTSQPIQTNGQTQPTAPMGLMPAYASPANLAAKQLAGQPMPAAQYGMAPASVSQAAYVAPQATAPMPIMPVAGNRINYLSQAQQPTAIMGQPGLTPPYGKRLNIQEGYRQ